MASPSSPCVLVVDDDPALLSALEFALQAEGYLVMSCADAEAAMRVPADQLSCLVIDFKLPDIDGLDLGQRLRGAGVTAPMILITSNPDARCRARAARSGAVIVEKPLLGDRLLREIRALTSPVLNP
jgi:two-component system, LuxR family, response regulator FixJ